MPCGLAKVNGSQLPIGLQIMGRSLDEARIFQIATLTSEALIGARRGQNCKTIARPAIFPFSISRARIAGCSGPVRSLVYNAVPARKQ